METLKIRQEVEARNLEVGDIIAQQTPYGEHRLTVDFVTADARPVGLGEFVTVIRVEGMGAFLGSERYPTYRTSVFGRDEKLTVIR